MPRQAREGKLLAQNKEELADLVSEPVFVLKGITAVLYDDFGQLPMKVMAADAETIGLDINPVEDKDALEIHHAVGEDLFNCDRAQDQAVWSYRSYPIFNACHLASFYCFDARKEIEIRSARLEYSRLPLKPARISCRSRCQRLYVGRAWLCRVHDLDWLSAL